MRGNCFSRFSVFLLFPAMVRLFLIEAGRVISQPRIKPKTKAANSSGVSELSKLQDRKCTEITPGFPIAKITAAMAASSARTRVKMRIAIE